MSTLLLVVLKGLNGFAKIHVQVDKTVLYHCAKFRKECSKRFTVNLRLPYQTPL